MKQQHQSARKARTRTLIATGGILQKSGLLEAFLIEPGDDLQNYNNHAKATTLLGFLTECFEKNEFDEYNLERWEIRGERMMQSN